VEKVRILPPAVRRLIDIERLRGQRSADEPMFVGPILALLNLFFLAYFERYLTRESSADTLALLIFLEISLFLALAIARFLSVTGETLRRTALFPTTSWERFMFTGLSNLRRPVSYLWWGSVILAFLILAHGSWAQVVLPALLFSFLVLCTQMVIAILLLAAGKGGGGTIVWALLAIALSTAVASLLFGELSLLRLFLPVQLVAEAIHGTGSGNLQPSLHAFALLAGLSGGSLLLARRIC
jgi:hypothetical protein